MKRSLKELQGTLLLELCLFNISAKKKSFAELVALLLPFLRVVSVFIEEAVGQD